MTKEEALLRVLNNLFVNPDNIEVATEILLGLEHLGFVLAPKEPTPEMVEAARKHHEGEPYLPYSLYKAMIGAVK